MRTVTGEEKRNKGCAACAALSLAGTLCLPGLLNLKGNFLAVSNSFSGVFFFGVCWFLVYRAWNGTDRRDRRGFAAAGVFSFLFTVAVCFGVQLDREENVDFQSPALWLTIPVWTAILTLWVHRAFELLSVDYVRGAFADRKQDMDRPEEEKENAGRIRRLFGHGPHPAAGIFLLIFFCWLIVFLAVYPGFFVYDAQDELTQVMTRNFTTHHPLTHVLLLGGTVLFVHKLTGSYNAGIAAYTLLQMLFLSGVFTYVIRWIDRRLQKAYGQGLKRKGRILSSLYFGLFPVVVMFALCSAKDGIFTAALLLLLLFTVDLAEERERFFASYKKPLQFGVSAVVMMSFRHNGMYALLVMAPLLIVFMKGVRKRTAALLGAAFGVYFLLSAGLAAAVGAESAGHQEMLTVPIQQLARTFRYDRSAFSDEDLETLYEILPEKALSFYTAKVSDGVKVWFDNEAFSADPLKYAALWARIGRKHPFTYLNAWLMTSYGFWYPDTVIDVYRGNGVFTFTYGDSSFFGYEVEEPGTRRSMLPQVAEWYRRLSLEITQQKVPVLSMLFSPGFLFWVYAFAFGYAYYRRKRELMPSFLLLFLVWLTVLLGPTYLPRYVLILWFALPVLWAELALPVLRTGFAPSVRR